MLKSFLMGLLIGLMTAIAIWRYAPQDLAGSFPWTAIGFGKSEADHSNAKHGASGGTKRRVPVIAVRAGRTQFVDRVEALGTLRANESVAVTSTVADTVSNILFDDGQLVKKGDVLVEMTTDEERALLAESKSILAEAKSQFDRSKGLAKRKITSKTILDQRQREYLTARARVTAMQARLNDRTIRAPFSGIIGLRIVSIGTHVSPGDTIARIEDVSVMKLDFSVPSTFLATLRPGLQVVAHTPGFGAQKFVGQVASLDNKVDEVTRTIRVRALIPNPERRLKPGLLMTIDLLKRRRQAITVSEEAIVPLGQDNFVFVIDEKNNTVQRRKVVTGTRRLGEIEILEGLGEGDLVVAHGTLRLRPGAVVEVQKVMDLPSAADGGLSKAEPGGRS